MINSNYYKDVLECELIERCKKNPHYSLSAFARDLGLSQSILSRLLSKKIKLSLSKAMAIAEKLELNKKEKENFLVSVSFDHDPNRMILTSSLDHIIANPIYNSILNTLKLDDFESNPQWISKKINYGIDEVQSAIEELKEAQLIKVEDDKWVRAFPKTESYDQVSPESQKNFHKEIFKKAISSLDDYSSEQRNITGITMSIDPEQLDIAAREITKFRERISKILENGKRKEVYQLEVGLFPL